MKKRLQVDKLEITFICNDTIKEWISTQNDFSNEFVYIYRTEVGNNNYKFNYDVLDGNGVKIGCIYFGSYNLNRQKIYLSIDNKYLYQGNLHVIYNIANLLYVEFDCISRMDLALDYDINIISRLYSLLKSEELDFIILNKKYNLNDRMIEFLTMANGSRKNPFKNKSFYIQNREKGLSLNCYDKSLEISDNDNEKDYINDIYYGFKSIYRLEVRINHKQLKETLNTLGWSDYYVLLMLMDGVTDELYGLYIELLSRLIRIQYKRTSFSVIDFLDDKSLIKKIL